MLSPKGNHIRGMKSHGCVLNFYLGSPWVHSQTTPTHSARNGSPVQWQACEPPCSCKVSPAPSHTPRTNRRGQFVPSSSRLRSSSYLHKTIWHHRKQRTDVPRARGPDDRQNVAEATKGQTAIPEVKGTQDNRDHSQPKVSVTSAHLPSQLILARRTEAQSARAGLGWQWAHSSVQRPQLDIYQQPQSQTPTGPESALIMLQGMSAPSERC